MAESLREEPPGGPESEAELSQRLARTKARSYGSTASVAAPLAERYVEHRLSAGDTLQGIALKYGVTVRRAPQGRPAGPGSREGGGASRGGAEPRGCRAGSGGRLPKERTAVVLPRKHRSRKGKVHRSAGQREVTG